MPIMEQCLDETVEWALGPLLKADQAYVTTADLSGSEVWTWKIWAGDDQASLVSGTGTLRTTDVGTADERNYVDVTFLKADIAALDPGIYRVRGYRNAGTDDGVIYDDDIKFTSAPGSATALVTTCTRNDLLMRQSWVESLQDIDESQSGFAEQRAEARLWRHRQVMSRVERDLTEAYRRMGAVAYVDPIVVTEGVDAGPPMEPTLIPNTTIQADIARYQGYLDADQIMTGSIDNGEAKNIDAWYALYMIAEGQAAGSTSDKPWGEWAKTCRSKAVRACSCWTALIDTDDDGVADFEIKP